MALFLYGKKESGYREMDYDALSDEQALSLCDLIHKVAVDFSEIRQLTVMSTRLTRALSYIEPKVVTVMDLKQIPVTSWREYKFFDKHLYDELRETMRPFLGKSQLRAWELLP